MLASGFSTLVQLYPIKLVRIQIGSGLPIVMGTSFAFVPTVSSIGVEFGIGAVIGAVIVGSSMEIIIGLYVEQLKKIISPLVIGSVLLSIGLYLLPVGVTYFAGGAGAQNAFIAQRNMIAQGLEVPANTAALASQFASWQNLLMGSVVFLTIVVLQRVAKGLLKVSAIVVAIIIGYILAVILGQVNFNPVANASFFAVPALFPIRPEFHLGPIIAMSIMVIVSTIETLGHINGMTAAVWDRSPTNREMQGGLLADCAGNIIASSLGTLPNTSFGQNIAIVCMTKAVNRFCVFITALVLIVAGLSPKFGAVLSVMPSSVLGGAVITVFAMIMLNGIKIISKAGFTERNVLIFVLTFGVGYAIANNTVLVSNLPGPLAFIFGNPTIAVCVIAIVLNMVFPRTEETAQNES
jgi:NCS2 family nucleobase:cation symporter-2